MKGLEPIGQGIADPVRYTCFGAIEDIDELVLPNCLSNVKRHTNVGSTDARGVPLGILIVSKKLCR